MSGGMCDLRERREGREDEGREDVGREDVGRLVLLRCCGFGWSGNQEGEGDDGGNTGDTGIIAVVSFARYFQQGIIVLRINHYRGYS